MRWKVSLLTAALGGVLLLGGAASAQARERDRECRARLRGEESKLERDIERHGFFSRQAEHRREKIRGLREGCRFEGRFNRRRDNDDRFRNGRHRHHWGDRDGDRDGDDRWDRHDRDDRGHHHE